MEQDDGIKDPSDSLPPKQEVVCAEEIGTDVTFVTHELHAEEDGRWAQLRVSYAYSYDGSTFTCIVSAYRAKENRRYEGNVKFYLSLVSGEGDVRELTGSARQTGEWIDLDEPYRETIIANQRNVTVGFDYIYDVGNASDPVLKTYKVANYRMPIPTISAIRNFTSSTFSVKGTGAIYRYTVVLDDGRGTIGAEEAFYDPWSVPVTVAENKNSLSFQAYQMYAGKVSERTAYVTVYRARITYPTANALVLAKDLVCFRGMAAPGTVIRVVGHLDHYENWSEVITVGKSDTTWEAPAIKVSGSGTFSVVAQLKSPNINHFYTDAITVRVMGLPLISKPPAGTVYEQDFLLTGSNGLAGARLRAFFDLTNDPVRDWEVVSNADGAWEGMINVPPGPISLVVEQDLDDVSSGRSAPQAFRIRPPTLKQPNVTISGTTVTFAGNGYYDRDLKSEIQFTVSGGAVQVPAPANAEVMPGGIWETAAQWPLGTYNVSVIQKIADNASGWIDSLPLTFEVKNILPDVSDVQFTNDYQPTFSGKGFNGATVNPRRPNSGDLEAPAVEVAGGRWSTQASSVWGPSFEREVHIKQFLDGHQSPNWFVLKVTIPPQAPGLNEPEDDGLSPRFSGTCWPGATVNIEYSDETGIVHKGIVSAGTWQFRRDKEFALDITHTVTVTQVAAQQTSQPTSTTFIVRRAMVTPVITQPPDGSEVGRAVTVEGTMGMVGATLQLRDKQFDRPLGDPKILSQDGDWSIDLSLEQFRLYTFDAQQTLDGRPSLHSDEHELTVVLLPPEFLQPIQHGKLPRTALLKGTGMRGGVVDVCLQGLAEPLLSDVIVDWAGNWQAEVTLPVGSKTIWARQRFMDESGKLQESKDSEPLHFDIVPAAPFIETPIEGDAIGQQVVVCGFGVPGDTVTVTLVGAARSEPASAVVQENRTWSVMLDASLLGGGLYRLEAVASLDEFESFETLRSVFLGTFRPVLDGPAAGRWVSHPVQFSGKGRPGVGAIVSWYNPDVQWLAQVPVVDEHWRGAATRALPLAGNWYRFRQTLTDAADDATMSDWADSARFEVEAARLPHADS
ncbi:hypothetical protein [Pseudomonas siliginis]|uniref:hypothetical protein n=1 Tax=Pseudomonas siliginis TaxID=2842346 RepID=UPI002092BB31|nr:hypothetical protein [Pseudomonas siliginis]UST94346.1 hypothetical protein NF679_20460 [Pseudomonas siliginis]